MLPPPMSGAQNRRRYPRYDARRLPGVLDGFRKLEALKLSLGGALVRLPFELALEQPVQIALDLGGETFRSSAVVVFVGPDLGEKERGAYRIGLSFVDTRATDRAVLERFIQASLGPPDPG